MTKNESPPKPDSTSSEQTDDSARSSHILALGRKLVEELRLEESIDTLSRWMAHYVAELIAKTEGATGEEKVLAEKECFDAIFALWKHRAELPNGKRPFEDLEPVVRTIESLDPDDDTPRYFRSTIPSKGERKEQPEVERWLGLVSSLDYSAKTLIGYCLTEAAHATADKSKEWVKLAEAAGAENGVAEIVIQFISANADLGREPDPQGEVRRQLQDRVDRLEHFTKLAEIVLRDFKARLEALPPPKDGDEDDSDRDLVLTFAPPLPPVSE